MSKGEVNIATDLPLPILPLGIVEVDWRSGLPIVVMTITHHHSPFSPVAITSQLRYGHTLVVPYQSTSQRLYLYIRPYFPSTSVVNLVLTAESHIVQYYSSSGP